VATSVELTQLTDTVHFAKTELVNWTLVTDDAGLLIIDAGYPGQRDEVLGTVRELGFGVDDIHAILLTHAHVDHFGTAIWFAKTHGTPVFCHVDEVGHARRDYLEQVSLLELAAKSWRPRYVKWSVDIARLGALTRAGIPTAHALTPEVAAVLPGKPQAVPSPGHTGGHCSYLVDGVLVSGDALVTGHPLSKLSGPQLLPGIFNHDQAGCLRSLDALGALDSDVVLPGHGPVWRGSLREAAQRAAAQDS
jgi:glyoxylase-like metal-dependent hydrolase (beta-lactamase superfamily II)